LRADPSTGMIVDEEGNEVFNRTELRPNGSLLPVYKKAAAKFKGLDEYDSDPDRMYETDQEDVLTESHVDRTGILARLATDEN